MKAFYNFKHFVCFAHRNKSFQSMTDKEKKQVWKFFEHSRGSKTKNYSLDDCIERIKKDNKRILNLKL